MLLPVRTNSSSRKPCRLQAPTRPVARKHLLAAGQHHNLGLQDLVPNPNRAALPSGPGITCITWHHKECTPIPEDFAAQKPTLSCRFMQKMPSSCTA